MREKIKDAYKKRIRKVWVKTTQGELVCLLIY